MTIPVLTQEDLAALGALAADLNFDDAERQAVLLEGGNRDVNAAPGSGKTTLLAAKLLLLARKWPHARRGICVLSHTNVARDEIRKRLANSAEGARLLAYPHFIGTIHAFVNQYLALPFLRSEGIIVDVIDDEAFEKRALKKVHPASKLGFWMAQDSSVEDKVKGLVYRGPELELASELSNLPRPTAPTFAQLTKIKTELTAQGIFRHADMFAYAERLIRLHPQAAERLSLRFPLLFIDEMQDTSVHQERLLNTLFHGRSIIQRYGDINQRILSQDEGLANLTFPVDNALPISTSKRFGPAIAKVVAGVQLTGTPVTGESQDVHRPLLLTYPTDLIQQVIPFFGQQVLQRFDDASLKNADVKALCTRKKGDGKVTPGRHLLDYWPALNAPLPAASNRPERFWELLSDKPALSAAIIPVTMAERANEIRRAILLVLRAAQSPSISNVRDGPQLIRVLQQDGYTTDELKRLVRDLALSNEDYSREDVRQAVPHLLFPVLRPWLRAAMDLSGFAALALFQAPAAAQLAALVSTHYNVEFNGRRLTIPVGTTASMKGETHLATLMLESYGGNSQRFDLKEALEVMAGAAKLPQKNQKLLSGQFRNMYVGMSRPTSFLCVAANQERVSAACKTVLLEGGWDILEVT